MITVYDMGSYRIEAKGIEAPPATQKLSDQQHYSVNLQLICVEDAPYRCEQPATLPHWLANRYIEEIDQ